MAPRARSSKSNTFKTRRLPEDHEWLISKIQQKWGIHPTELFPEQSCRHPRAWTALLLNELVKLTEVATLEKVKEIFERYRSPITNQTIIDARTECMRTRMKDQHVPEQPNTPGSQTTDMQDIIFVASEHRTSTATFTPVNGARLQSRPPSDEACFSPKNFAELMGHTPQSKKRKMYENETESLEGLEPPETATETPDLPQLVIHVPSRSEDSPAYARAVESLVAAGLENFEKQYNEQYHQAEETSAEIERLNAENIKLVQQLEQLREHEGVTNQDILMFADVIRSLQEKEKEQDKLEATLQARLQARKSTVTPHDDSQHDITPPISQQESPQEHNSETGPRGSHKWSVELGRLEDALAMTTGQKDETAGKVAAVNRDIISKRQKLEEEKDALARTRHVVRSWISLKAIVTKGVAQTGVLNTEKAPSV